jgi:branched-chain amino acid transport system substrate-binding protein
MTARRERVLQGEILMTGLLSRWPLEAWLPRFCALLVISLAAVAPSPAIAQLKLGFQAPLTGAAATDGVSARIAAEMASEKINAGGGVLGQKIELVTYDDQAKTEEAVFTANKLVGQDGVKFAVSGSYSASGRAAAPIFQKAGVPFISAYGVHPDITRSGNYVFRGVHLGPPQGRAAAKFLGDDLGLKRVSIVSMDNDYGQATFEGFKSAIDQFGIKVLGEYTYSLKDRQFGSIVASVKRDNPDVIYVTGSLPHPWSLSFAPPAFGHRSSDHRPSMRRSSSRSPGRRWKESTSSAASTATATCRSSRAILRSSRSAPAMPARMSAPPSIRRCA